MRIAAPSPLAFQATDSCAPTGDNGLTRLKQEIFFDAACLERMAQLVRSETECLTCVKLLQQLNVSLLELTGERIIWKR